ncbi:hypothetical protein NQ176_g591 [Zarea fungicola]|uniref:Uncharacterized protein n=1 Tax=Zarea fungicola TaxID=93591 RepID=A0ACC1NW53_9HYPO|nr:hypothetical protein NQ176_g591 [Lecanicillium fungicola]
MAHVRNRLSPETSAPIFSPSVARVAASEARDWSFIDSWLASQFLDRQPLPFERNADTLKALVGLIAYNETASEEARLLARTDRDDLGELSQQLDSACSPDVPTLSRARDSVLYIVEQELPKEGKLALDSLANMAIAAQITLPDPEKLCVSILGMQSFVVQVEQLTSRVETLERQIRSDVAQANVILAAMQNVSYMQPDGLVKDNTELKRIIKAMTAQMPEFERQVTSMKIRAAPSDVSVHDILEREREYLALVQDRKELDKRISVFRALPSDPDLAREELNAYRQELRGITSQRDAAFQGLVDRETPAKRR